MVAWLSDWLRNIIAVILLAALVELLLPNKSMQRYARLVVGLFILLTILSPILKLFQSDIGSRLDSGLALWNESDIQRGAPMTGLAQIRQDAEKLAERRNQEAAMLAERTLEESMTAELRERADAGIEQVDAELKWIIEKGSQTPYISRVTVTLRPEDKQGEVPDDAVPVEDVKSVMVDVTLDESEAGGSPPEESWEPADPAAAAAVSGVLANGWGLRADQIIVRQPVQT